MTTTLGSSFTTTVRMIDRVHRRATHVRPSAQPTLAAGLAQRDVHVVGVADLADRGPTLRPARDEFRHWASVSCAQSASRAISVALEPALRQSTPPRPGCISILWTRRTQRNPLQRQAVADGRRRLGTALDAVALPSGRREPGCIASRRRHSAAGRCVHCGSDRTESTRPGRDTILVPQEIDHAILPLVTTATVPGRDLALVVATALLAQRTQQRLLRLAPGRQIGKVADARATPSGRGRFVFSNAHRIVFSCLAAEECCVAAGRNALERGSTRDRIKRTRCDLRVQRHDRLLPVLRRAVAKPVTTRLALAVLRSHLASRGHETVPRPPL